MLRARFLVCTCQEATAPHPTAQGCDPGRVPGLGLAGHLWTAIPEWGGQGPDVDRGITCLSAWLLHAGAPELHIPRLRA